MNATCRLTLAAVALAASSAVAAPPSAAEVRTRVDRHVTALAADGGLSGCVLVARGAEVQVERCVGLADAELAVPATAATRFNVGTVSEVLTRVALLRLVDEKKLALADPVARFVPRVPQAARMTVADLVEHRSGLPPRVTHDDQEALPRWPSDVVELVASHPLRFEPGTRREPSAAGYGVLARVLETAARTSWPELLRSRVTEPAGLAHTTHATARDVVPGRARGYLPWVDGTVRNAPPKDLSTFVGSASVVATARDVYLLVRAIRDGKLGPSVSAWAAELPRFSWSSAAHGFSTFVEDDAATGLTVVFTGNLATPEVERLRSTLPRLAAGARLATPRRERRETPKAVPFEALLALEGRYTTEESHAEVRAHRDGVLIAGDRVLVPTGDGVFRCLADDAVVTAAAGALEWRTSAGTARWTRAR